VVPLKVVLPNQAVLSKEGILLNREGIKVVPLKAVPLKVVPLKVVLPNQAEVLKDSLPGHL